MPVWCHEGSIALKQAVSVLILAASLCGTLVTASAQHATAFDIEDGGRAFQNVCANCHGPDGDLIPEIDLGRGLFRRPLTDDDLVAIILEGIPGTTMPATPSMSEAQAREIVAYLRASAAARPESSIPGDPARGRRIVENSGQCLDCHRISGVGSGLGPDLSNVGMLRRAAELERSLLEPQAEVQPDFRWYEVTTSQGDRVSGRLLNHDTFSVQLLDENLELRSFRKAGLSAFGFLESPMPSVRDEMSDQDVADVVSFLVTLRGESEQ